MKLIILIIDSLEPHYVRLKQTQKDTWNNKNFNNHTTFYYSFNNSVDKITHTDTDLIIPGNEGFFNIGKKTLIAFDYILNNFDFDFVFRTNLSSYIDTKLLYEHINNNNLIYDGIVGNFKGLFEFCSGSGYVIRKDIIKKVIDNQNIWNHQLIDDCSLAEVLHKQNIFPDKKAKRYDYHESFNVFYNERNEIQQVKTDVHKSVLNNYHYRIKIPNNRNLELDIHREIHKLRNLHRGNNEN